MQPGEKELDMRTGVTMLVAALAMAMTGCADSADSIVGTDGESSNPILKKGGGKGPPGGGDPTERPITVTFENRDGIRSDGRGTYVDGVCGVWANVGNLNDMRMDPDRNYKRKTAKTCADYAAPRLLVFEFDDDRGVKEAGAFMTVEDIDPMALDEVKTTWAQFNVCNVLRFGNVQATRTADGWTVTTDGASDLAVCADGSEHSMPFTLTIAEQ